MTRFREHRERSRRKLHEAMALPAFYYRDGSADEDPLSVTVRPSTEFGALGDIKGTSFAYAEKESQDLELIFWAEQIIPRKNAVVMLREKEGFRINTVKPRYGQTITVRVVRLGTDDADLYDYPNG